MSFLMENLTQDFEMYSLHKMYLKCINILFILLFSSSITVEKRKS